MTNSKSETMGVSGLLYQPFRSAQIVMESARHLYTDIHNDKQQKRNYGRARTFVPPLCPCSVPLTNLMVKFVVRATYPSGCVVTWIEELYRGAKLRGRYRSSPWSAACASTRTGRAGAKTVAAAALSSSSSEISILSTFAA